MAIAFNVGIYKSTDTGAPSLQGQVSGNTGLAVLDAVLLNGYNSGTCTITRSGSMATVSRTGHGFNNDQLIRHTGADQSEYNIDTRITVVDANTYTYIVSGTPVTPATGTITCKVCPAGGGWTKPTSGSNYAAYKQPGGNQLTLIVDESAAGYIATRGYESYTSTGNSGAFPSGASYPNGSILRKSSTTDSTARPWVIAATDRHLYWFVNDTSSSPLTATSGQLIFGDLCSFKTGDAYATVLIGAQTNSGTDDNFARLWFLAPSQGPDNHFLCRSYTQVGGWLMAWKRPLTLLGQLVNWNTQNTPLIVAGGAFTQSAQSSGSTDLSAQCPYPMGADGGLYLDGELAFYEADRSRTRSSTLRGILPGLWCPSSSRPLTHLDTYSGNSSGALNGKKFLAHNIAAVGQVHIETTNTWRTSPY